MMAAPLSNDASLIICGEPIFLRHIVTLSVCLNGEQQITVAEGWISQNTAQHRANA